MSIKAQGTIEYLIVLAIVVVIGLVVAGFATGFLSSGSQAVRVSQDISGAVGSGSVSVLEGVSDTNGDAVLRLKNSTGEIFSVSKISGLSDGESVVDKQFNDVVVPVGGDVSFSLDNLSGACVCGAGDSRKICEFEITLTSVNGLEKKQRVSKSVDCVTNTTPGASVVNPFGAVFARGAIEGTGTSIDEGHSIFVDSSGNIYVAGKFASTSLGFGNDINLTGRGNYDFFVVKYNSSGVAQWAKNPFVGTGSTADSAEDVFVDSNGDVYLIGTFSSPTISFGNDINLTRRAFDDFFLVKYNSSGVAQWAKNPANGTATNNESAYSVFVTSSGNIYLGGYFFSTVLGFGNDINLTNRGNSDFFVGKYDSSGNPVWAKNPGQGTGLSGEYAFSVFVDLNENIYLSGYFDSATIGFGNDVNLTRRGSFDFFVVKYNSSGVAQWAKNPGQGTGASIESAMSVFVDLSGNIYFGGSFDSTTLGFGNDVNLTNRGGNDFYVVKYNSGGVAQWAKNPASGTGLSGEYVAEVFVDLSGNVYLSGYFDSSTVSFGNGISLTNSGGLDFFIAKYDSSGNALWATSPMTNTGNSTDRARSLFVDSSENIFITGDFDSANVGFSNDLVLTNRSNYDFFVVKYGYR